MEMPVYYEVTYITIKGAGGSVRRWCYELAEWMAKNEGAMIVGLRVLP